MNISDRKKPNQTNKQVDFLTAHFDVEGLDFISTGEDTGTGNTAEDVGAGSLHEGHETLGLDDLHAAVN